MMDRCWRCGREITDPLSVYVGMGPICRAACGIVKAYGWGSLERLAWWSADTGGYRETVRRLADAFRWWGGQSLLLDPGLVRNFHETLGLISLLRETDPRRDGLAVMGLVWGIVARVRFVLEPTLRTLEADGTVTQRCVESVPGLADVMPSLEVLLCGLYAWADAVELAEVRIADKVRVMEGRALEPESGVEASG